MAQIMVLSDGETFTDLKGCKIVEVNGDIDAVDLSDYDSLNLVAEFGATVDAGEDNSGQSILYLGEGISYV